MDKKIIKNVPIFESHTLDWVLENLQLQQESLVRYKKNEYLEYEFGEFINGVLHDQYRKSYK